MPTAIEEKDAIRDAMAEYCFRLDGGRYDDMAALFTEDGTWDTAFGKATGRAAIAGLARDIRAVEQMASAPRCARTGPWCRTAPKGQRSGRAAPTPTRWQSKTDDGCSAIARSTASSPPEAGSNEDSGIAIWDVAIAREGETISGGDRLRPPAPVADQTQHADEQCDRGSTGSGVNLGSGRDVMSSRD